MKSITTLHYFTLAAALVASTVPSAAAVPRLLPFQGRLTDANGTPLADGAKVVQFKIYSAPTGGTIIWSGEVQKLTINGGLVSTLLGSKADLFAVDFNNALYLEITVDANSDSQITAADPPLLPRQSVLPAVFAVETATMSIVDGGGKRVGAAGWGALVTNATDSDTSNWRINGGKLADNSVGNSQIALATITGDRLVANTVTGSQIAPLTVGVGQLADNAVTNSKLADGSVTAAKLSTDVTTPAGTVVAYVGTTAPTGWLICNGALVAIATYPNLAAVIGTKFGSTPAPNFKLPDFQGYFLRGVDGGTGRDPDAAGRSFMADGGATGNAVGSVQADALQRHRHMTVVPADQNTSQSVTSPEFAIAFRAVFRTYTDRDDYYLGGHSGEPSTGKTSTVGAAAETRPKNAYVNYIIKY